MSRKSAEGVAAGPRIIPAANEEFTETDERELEYPRTGWDPYEVWRTRVKASSRKAEPEHDPRR